MKGFNYTTQADFDLPVGKLREELQHIVDNGGFRRHENAETFAHGKDGVIIWEAYGNVTLKKEKESTRQLCIDAHPDDVEAYADNG